MKFGQQEVTGDNVLIVIFAERLSPAVRSLFHARSPSSPFIPFRSAPWAKHIDRNFLP